MWPALRSTFTFKIILVSLILMALGMIPYPYPLNIFAFILYFPLNIIISIGCFPHLILLCMAADILNKKASKILLLIPLLPYALYYVFFVHEAFHIRGIERNMKEKKPSEVITYNPQIHSLVIDHAINARYKVPVRFVRNPGFPDGYESSRLASRKLYARRGLSNRYEVMAHMSWSLFFPQIPKGAEEFKNIGNFYSSEKPDKSLLEVQISRKRQPDPLLDEMIYKFSLNQKIVGEYTNGSYQKLANFPMLYAGCLLERGDSKCIFQLSRKKIFLNPPPKLNDNENLALERVPNIDENENLILETVAYLLKIEKYTEDDIRNFVDYPETVEKINALIAKQQEANDVRQ